MMRRLLAIVSAFALLMGSVGMATAATPSTYDWQGNGYPNATCDAGSTTALWIWTGDNPLSLTINGHEQTGSWTQMGNGSWHYTITIDGTNFPPTTASITYTGAEGTLTLSGCDEGGAQPTPLPAVTPTPTPPTPLPAVTPTPTPPTPLPAVTPTSTSPTPLPAVTPTPTPTPTPTGAVAGETGTPTPTGAVAGETGTPAPYGAVLGVTGTPDVTPPPTDTLGSVQPAPSNEAWRMVLIGLAAMLISVLAFANRARSGRRR